MLKNILKTLFLSSLISSVCFGNSDQEILEKHKKQLRPSRKDFKLGKQFVLIYKLSIQNEIDLSSIDKFLKNTQNNTLFSEFHPWLHKLKQINSIENVDNFAKVCSPIFETTQFNNYQKYFHEILIQWCQNSFLDLFSKKENQNLKKNKIQMVISKTITHLLENDEFEYVTEFLEKTAEKGTFYESLSLLISSYYIQNNLQVPKPILSKIEISDKLTGHIQKYGYSQNSSQKIFVSEFKRLIRSLKTDVDKSQVEIDEIGDRINEITQFYTHNQNSITKKKAWRLFMYLGKCLLNRRLGQNAHFVYNFALEIAPKNKYDENLFQIMWSSIFNDNFEDAYQTIVKFDILKNFEQLSPDIQFWTAYTLEKKNQAKNAKIYYRKLVSSISFNYYTIMASKKLKELGDDDNTFEKHLSKNFRENKFVPSLTPDQLAFKFINSYKRLHIWSRLNIHAFINIESKNILSLQTNELINQKTNSHNYSENFIKEQITIMTAHLLASNEHYLYSFSLIYSGISSNVLRPNKNLLSTLFPAPFLNQIKKLENEIDPIIFLSLIRQESAFNPRAKSRVGARGLMQLMPKTARQEFGRLKAERLENPSLNLKIGIGHFKKLYEKYEGNLVYALSAYNAGEYGLKRWVNNIFQTDSILHTIESIPYNETKKYVKLIFRNIFFYKYLESKEKDGPELNKIYNVSLGLEGN